MDRFDVMGDRTIGDVLGRWARRQPDDDFLHFISDADEVTRFTWSEFEGLVQELRARLGGLHANGGRVVVGMLPNSPSFHAFWFSTACNGAAFLPLDPSSGTRHVERICEMVDPACIVVTPDQLPQIEGIPGRVVRVVVSDITMDNGLSEVEGLPAGAPSQTTSPSSESVAGMLQTSGTTGMPKLVEITHANYVFSGESLCRNIGIGHADRNFIAMPLFHAGAQLYSTMSSLVNGGSLGYVQSFSASKYFEQAKRTRSTIGTLLAPPMRMVLNRTSDADTAGPVDTGQMRLLIYAQNLSRPEYDKWEEYFPQVRLVQMYGQTESIALPVGRAPYEDLPRESMGRPLLGTEIRLVNEDGELTDTGPGEIHIRGERGRTLAHGYFNNPEATGDTFKDGWLRTGDIVRRDADGCLYFIARSKHIARRGGENISLPEVEIVMQEYPDAEDVALAAEPDPVLDEKLVAYVIPRDNFSSEAFVRWCGEAIGRHGVPNEVHVVNEFPRTGVGKVRLDELKNQVEDNSQGSNHE